MHEYRSLISNPATSITTASPALAYLLSSYDEDMVTIRRNKHLIRPASDPSVVDHQPHPLFLPSSFVVAYLSLSHTHDTFQLKLLTISAIITLFPSP